MGLEVAERLEFGVLGLLEVRRAGERCGWVASVSRCCWRCCWRMQMSWRRWSGWLSELFGGQRSDAAVNAVRAAVSRLRRLPENGAREGGAPGRVGELIEEIEALIAADLLRERLRLS